MESIENQYYQIELPPTWASTLEDEQLAEKLTETDFAREKINEGKDYCYFLNRYLYTDGERNIEYTLMAYTLAQAENLEVASRFDVHLNENQQLKIHRIAVFRNGKIINKLPDTTIKILDNEDQSGIGVLNNSKKLNFITKDLRLGDIIIREESYIKTIAEKDFMMKDFYSYIFIAPDSYWSYGSYNFRLINQREKRIAYKDFFFRDKNDAIIPSQKKILEKGEEFCLSYENYTTETDGRRQVYPFIHFATDADWEGITNYIFPLYDQVYQASNLAEFAPEIVEKLDRMASLDEKIQYAIEYVQDNIYYLFSSEVMNGHRPQHPAVTYETKQGDCKAKTVLLKVILDYLGVDSNAVLVSTGTGFYQKYYLPSPFNFNHVILKISTPNKDYFVDSTHRNERGTLDNRVVLSYGFYLDILAGEKLKFQASFHDEKYSIEERIHMKAVGNVGEFTVRTIYRYGRADHIRNYFRNTDKKEILDSWNNSMFYCLNYAKGRDEKDFRTIFDKSSVVVENDDRVQNELVVLYRATIEKPYSSDPKGKRFLEYWDANTLKRDLMDYISEDVSYWHDFASEYYEILLETDLRIDTDEYYTKKECSISNEFFDYQTRKEITPHSGKVTIEYKPVRNKIIELEDLERIKGDYQKITDSNYGIGIDVIEPGFFNMLKHKLRRI